MGKEIKIDLFNRGAEYWSDASWKNPLKVNDNKEVKASKATSENNTNFDLHGNEIPIMGTVSPAEDSHYARFIDEIYDSEGNKLEYDVEDLKALESIIPAVRRITFPFEVNFNKDGTLHSIPETDAETLQKFSKKYPPLEGEAYSDYWVRLGQQKDESLESYFDRVEEKLGYDLDTQEGMDALSEDERIIKIREDKKSEEEKWTANRPPVEE